MPTVPDIFDAIASSDLDQLKQLVGNDPTLAASRNEAGVSALMTAAYHQNADMVKLLRDTNPELDIFEAASLGDVARVRTLQGDPKSATSQSSDGFTPLHLRPSLINPR